MKIINICGLLLLIVISQSMYAITIEVINNSNIDTGNITIHGVGRSSLSANFPLRGASVQLQGNLGRIEAIEIEYTFYEDPNGNQQNDVFTIWESGIGVGDDTIKDLNITGPAVRIYIYNEGEFEIDKKANGNNVIRIQGVLQAEQNTEMNAVMA